MDFLTDWLTNWLKELLIGGIMGNLEGLTDYVNAQVGEIAVQEQDAVGVLLDGGRRRTKNLYGVFKRTVPAGQVRQ